jgi:hypothetical protein
VQQLKLKLVPLLTGFRETLFDLGFLSLSVVR